MMEAILKVSVREEEQVCGCGALAERRCFVSVRWVDVAKADG